jgi:hypothetical protein
MDVFLGTLKKTAQAKHWRWKLTPCGGRQAAYEAFLNARRRPAVGELIVLLVDSEGPVTSVSRAGHLRERAGDGWDLTDVAEDHVHLMVQAMEAWIVADPDALADYYGQKFQRSALPRRRNLEEEPKADCARKLSDATRLTQKGEYRKIRHAADLLARIATAKVRTRCPHADEMFLALESLMA